MAADRLQRIRDRLSPVGDAVASSNQLCLVAAEITLMTGAGIMLADGEEPRGSLCTSDRVSERIEALQYTLGEGPCVDAHTSGAAVAEPELAWPKQVRWPAFAPLAVEAGAQAIFGFPLLVGNARLGALNLYRDRPGPLSRGQHADAMAMAHVAAQTILTMQAAASSGNVAAELEADANFNFVVHQAAGMVSIQLGVSVSDALVRLRSHAFAADRLIVDVAGDVVNRRVRFNDQSG